MLKKDFKKFQKKEQEKFFFYNVIIEIPQKFEKQALICVFKYLFDHKSMYYGNYKNIFEHFYYPINYFLKNKK